MLNTKPIMKWKERIGRCSQPEVESPTNQMPVSTIQFLLQIAYRIYIPSYSYFYQIKIQGNEDLHKINAAAITAACFKLQRHYCYWHYL